jgi:tetratricopeptide (TPR) repeat protein
MSPERPPKVFISYSHDSPEHEDRVLDLAKRLVEKDGIDVSLDRFVNPPPASWPKWMNAEMKAADFILVVCSATYLAKVESKVKPGEGKGVKWESLLSYQQIYDNDSDSSRFIPVLLEGGKYEHIPDPLRGSSHYRPEDDAEYEKLIRHITNQPETPKPKSGPLRKLPPKQRQTAKSPATKAVPVSAVSKPWNVPHARNEAFTGREQILTDLHADLLKKSKQALFGLGGVGKTQIAVEYAYRHRDEYTTVLWSFAGTEQSVRGGYAAIASLLDLPEKDSQEQAKITDAVKSWLEQNIGWLLVLDNADDPATVKPFLPQHGKGHVLVTSRAHTFQTLGILVPREVEVLSPKDARAFLLYRTGKAPAVQSPEADMLARELGYLPLALEQAAAYLVENSVGFASYLDGFKKQRQALLNKQGPVLGNDEREQQKRTVATAWALNFADIEKGSAASAELLRLSAFLAPDSIPLELLENGAKELPEKLVAKMSEAADNPLTLDEPLSPLLRFSLIRRDDEKRTYSIHPLVQEVVRDGLGKENQKVWAELAVRTVNLAFPDPEFENWPACDRLLPHTLACAGLIEFWDMEFDEAARLLNQIGYYLKQRAEYAQAEPLYQRALAIWERTLGPEHQETATSLNNLAALYHEQGRYKEAAPLLRRALAIHEKALDPEHVRIAASLNNLADHYRTQGKYDEAEPLFRRALAICEKTLGPEHPQTASSLNNLSLLLYARVEYQEAEPLQRRALAIREKALGPDHPDTATSLNNLAGILEGQWNFAEAESLYRRALAIFEKALGFEHPNTVRVRDNLILFYREHVRHAEADAPEKSAKKKAE